MIDFVAYDIADQVVHARIDFQGDRLIDLLATAESIVGSDIRSRSLSTGQVGRPQGGAIRLADIAVVAGTGPRGSDLKRIRTIVAPVTIYASSYTVHGYLHAPDYEGLIYESPIAFAERRAWLPLTEAALEYSFRWQAVRERHDVVLVNRLHVKAVVLADERSHETHWLASGTPIDWAHTGDRL